MSVNRDHILYNLADVFRTSIGTNICDATDTFMKKHKKNIDKMNTDEKLYYNRYAINIVTHLSDYLGEITMFELYNESDDEEGIKYDFKLTREDGDLQHVSLAHKSIVINDIIPDKLMKICGYKKSAGIYKSYTPKYESITKNAHKKIKDYAKYNDVPDKIRQKEIFTPICELLIDTLDKKRKCSEKLYGHLFGEPDRIVIKMYKTRYEIFDFGKELEEVESYKIKYDDDKTINVTFNNGIEFKLVLFTNASVIKKHLSVKFHTDMVNMKQTFCVAAKTV